jgi:hypothetical protein
MHSTLRKLDDRKSVTERDCPESKMIFVAVQSPKSRLRLVTPKAASATRYLSNGERHDRPVNGTEQGGASS